MGVTGLHGALAPYAEEMQWQKQAANRCSQSLIIDGPALAYHIYYQLLSQKRHTGHPLRAMPSYQDLAAGAVDYLEILEAFGLRTKFIFFDGFLPEAKTSIRLERLQKYVDQMRAVRLVNPSLEDAGESRQGDARRAGIGGSSFSAGYVPVKIKAMPAMPFIVPAVIEGLKSSKFADVTMVVPGEADLQCSDPAVCDESNIILTGDSDLILQAPRGRIIFFNGLQMKNAGTSEEILTGESFSSRNIAEKTNLPMSRLVLMGFLLQHQPTDGIARAARQARDADGDEDDSPEFRNFAALYRPFCGPIKTWKEVFDLDSPTPRVCTSQDYVQQLDARVSEFVLTSILQPTSPRPMYLPYLLDDPTRSSAWRSSISIRQIAYSTWLRRLENADSVLEYDRRGTRAAGNAVLTLAEPALSESMQKLGSQLEELRQTFPGNWEPDVWCSVCLVFLIRRESMSESGRLPAVAEVLQLISRDYSKYTWAALHLHSQLEGLIYSLRLLAQVLRLSVSLEDAMQDSHLQVLYKCLMHLPGICQMLASPGRTIGLSSPALVRAMLEPYYGKMEIASITNLGDQKPRKKRKKQADVRNSGSRKKTAPSNNMFDLLDDES